MPNKTIEIYKPDGTVETITVVISATQQERDEVPVKLQAALNRTQTILTELQTIQNHGTALSTATGLLNLTQTKALGADLATLATDVSDLVKAVRALLIREFDPS